MDVVTLQGKTRTELLTVILVSLFLLASTSLTVAQASVPTYTYTMSFDKDGFTTVEVLYVSGSPGSGNSWVAVPKNFTSTTVTAVKGTISSMNRLPYRPGGAQTVHPFYDNLTFSYDSTVDPFSMRILFNMTNGAMIVEPNGFFYSPQIGVSPLARVEGRLILPEGVGNFNEVFPTPSQVERLGSHLELFFDLAQESRIALTFTVSWPIQTSHLREAMIEGDVPTRYAELGTRVVELYRQAVPLMNSLFNNTMNNISFRFFIPLTLPQLSIGGYTPIDPSTFKTGAIYLNLFYFRAVSGTMETIALHELTHQYLAVTGISPDLLWVHEGLANYVAVQMGQPLGYDVYSTDADLETAATQVNGRYGIIQNWQLGASTTSLFLYYAASYKVFKTLGDQYGGLTLYSKFFRGIHELKDGVRSTDVAVYQLSLAAETDLYPQFTGWGFEVVDLSNIDTQITKLLREAQFYGPLLPFREEALGQIQQAENSKYTDPETAFGHLKIAAYYIETVPMIIGAILIMIILFAAIVAMIIRRRQSQLSVPPSDVAPPA